MGSGDVGRSISNSTGVDEVDIETANYLSTDDISDLEELRLDRRRRAISSQQMLRPLKMALAALSCGRLVLTAEGRKTLAAKSED